MIVDDNVKATQFGEYEATTEEAWVGLWSANASTGEGCELLLSVDEAEALIADLRAGVDEARAKGAA